VVTNDNAAVEKHFNMVLRLALARCGEKHRADDVVQEVFYRFLKKDREFENEEHLKAWLIKVTINCSKNVFLDDFFRNTAELTEEISFNDPEESDVYYAVLSLPSKYRTVIHLFYYEDMQIKEIAEILNTKETTVKSQLHRAREMLKEKLKEDCEIV
jgi:RNA polymerase sigma-70 factor (ECF subfamily)